MKMLSIIHLFQHQFHQLLSGRGHIFEALSKRHCGKAHTLKGSLFILYRPEPPLEGETGDAPPAAGKASRFRGSGAIGGPVGGRESPCRDGVGAAAGGGEVAAPHLPTTDTSPPHWRSRD